MEFKQNKVLLIVPTPHLSPVTKSRHPPFGALFLAESLILKKYCPIIIDSSMLEVFKNIDLNIKGTIAFGISTMSGSQLLNAIKIIKYLKRKYPKIPLIIGGAHTTALPKQTLEYPLIDYIVWGEGEQSLPLLLDQLKNKGDFSKIKGIGYKQNGKLIINKNIGFTSLDRVFNLPYHLVDMHKVARKLNIGVNKSYSMWTSRGCPFRCKFCSNSSKLWSNTRVRFHTIKDIFNNLDILIYKYGADCITFSDENFIIDEDRLINIFKEIIKRNYKKKFRISGRIDMLDNLKYSTLELLKKGGVIGVGAGVESGSQKILNYIGKNITLKQIYSVDRKLTKLKFFKTYNFMTCVPEETKEDLLQTLKLIIDIARTSKYCPYPFGTLHKYIPLPETELYKESIKNGFVEPKDFEGWGNFDFYSVAESRKLVRPWIDDDLFSFITKANKLIEDLNYLFIGKGCDEKDIDEKIKDVEKFIKNGGDKE